jgi:hypothetical protein
MPKTLEEILAAAVAAKEAEVAAQQEQNITKADLGGILQEFKSGLMGEIEEAVKKAMPAAPQPNPDYRGQGVGQKGTVASPEKVSLDSNPIEWLVQKSQAGEEWDVRERELISGLFQRVMGEGLRPSSPDYE